MNVLRCWISDGLLILALYIVPKNMPEAHILLKCLEKYANAVSKLRGFDA